VLPTSSKVATASSSERKRSNNKDSEKQKSSRSDWFEERVAQFKKEQDIKYDEDEQQQREQDMMMGSFSTLSTKETLERRHSGESNPLVRMPTGGIDGGNGGGDTTRDQKEIPSSKNKENQDDNDDDDDYQEEEENNVAVWSPPDEEVANQVWEKALAKHGEQESLCNQFEEYYDKDGEDAQEDQAQDHQDDNQANIAPGSDGQDGLPPGWEAIHDPSSGDYYYNNWETGEVTWDKPGGNPTENETPVNQVEQDNEPSPMSPLEDNGAVGDSYDDGPYTDDDNSTDTRSTTQSYNDKKPAAATTAHNNNDTYEDAPPLVQYNKNSSKRNNNSRYSQSDNDESENYVFDDQSSTSSGIAALSRWNKPVAGKSPSPTLGRSDIAQEEDDDMIVWSDDEEITEGNNRPSTIERSGSTVSEKPWHKKDDAEEIGSHDGSFIYD